MSSKVLVRVLVTEKSILTELFEEKKRTQFDCRPLVSKEHFSKPRAQNKVTYKSLRMFSSRLMSMAIFELAYMIIELRKVKVVSSRMRGSTTSFMY